MQVPSNAGRSGSAYELQLDNAMWLCMLDRIENIIDRRFKFTGLIREAMFPIQIGYARLTQGTSDRFFQQGNRKLAMLGDTIMRSIIVDAWARYDETVLSLDRRVAKTMCNKNFVRHAYRLFIDRLVVGYFPDGILPGKHVLATTMKAIVGAVWYDSNHDMWEMRELMDLLLETKLAM
ncbi:uncharacterized protein RCC_00192 [Ramularia collo-cygni]|uniref:RNase III domain-containing protein n=1 Tax=Ramularia collo-cygni TaxID=112498 RepID=A0A2D3UMR7_9PEZI|nr:uncharacterized protein RCC_00192 [Ramularia collo-cygni]CZT14218.1 uncharacterized protein RCC_00192 [Ramularia collo-cygni]